MLQAAPSPGLEQVFKTLQATREQAKCPLLPRCIINLAEEKRHSVLSGTTTGQITGSNYGLCATIFIIPN